MIIVAQSTPSGLGALGIIRLSGFNVRTLLDNMLTLKSKKKIVEVKTHSIHYGICHDLNNNEIDHVMVAIMDSPSSFTGENSAEITCHNNQFIISKIIQTAIFYGARLANRGEFTERAVINNKIDIFQAEAINELLHAQNEITTKIALCQLNGSLSSQIQQLEKMLNDILAWCHANFEFLEEERNFTSIIINKINLSIAFVDNLLIHHNTSIIIKNGISIGLIGHVNVGKSSLLNSLIGYKRAIVSDIAGTTRDSIDAPLIIDKYSATLTDTAGIRISNDIIEQEGITRSIEVLKKSDIILLIYTEETMENNDIALWYQSILEQYNKKIIAIKNKSDLSNKKNIFDNEITCCTKDENAIKEIHQAIKIKIESLLHLQTPEYIINTRHLENLNIVKNNLVSIKNKLTKNLIFYEIIIEELYQTQEAISILQAKSIQNNVFESIFSTFCIGK